MKIRIASIEDIEQYTDLLQRTYQDAYTNEEIGLTADCFSKEIFYNEDTQRYLKSHLVDTDSQKTWLAFDAEILVGSVTCIIRNNNEAEITGLYVHPNFQRNGIGKKLYNVALAFSGSRDLVLDIYTHNVKTIEIYKRWGWKLDESRGDRGYFERHWPEWPEGLQAKCMYMRLKSG